MPITGITIEADSVVLKGSDFNALYALAEENNRLRQELSLAEEGLANATQEIEQLKALLWLVPRDYVKEIDEWQIAQSEVHPTTNEEKS